MASVIIDRIISTFAPHDCLSCGVEGHVLCNWCRIDNILACPSRCYKCHVLTDNFSVCPKCRRKTALSSVWIAAIYDGLSEKLVKSLKFGRNAAVAPILAEIMANALPFVPKDTIITHAPTATARRRQRGYDQSELIAKHLAKSLGLKHKRLLIRHGQSRQLGAKRAVRTSQLQDAFATKLNEQKIDNVMLVDDVVTTGATLDAASKALKQAGAGNVKAVVFAQK